MQEGQRCNVVGPGNQVPLMIMTGGRLITEITTSITLTMFSQSMGGCRAAQAMSARTLLQSSLAMPQPFVTCTKLCWVEMRAHACAQGQEGAWNCGISCACWLWLPCRSSFCCSGPDMAARDSNWGILRMAPYSGSALTELLERATR